VWQDLSKETTSTKSSALEKLHSRRTILGASLAAAALGTLPFVSELRIADVNQPLTDEWSRMPIASRGSSLLGISFRPLQIIAFGMDIRSTLQALLKYPIQIVRVGVYWDRIEPYPGVFDTSELDWIIDSIEGAGAKIILCVGALKTFGFPDYHIPQHYMPQPFADRTLITPAAHPALLDAAQDSVSKIVERYKSRESIIAWQLENEPADPLFWAHYWRISTAFVTQELVALRAIDRTKPVMINGGLTTSLSLKIGELLMTSDQGNSLTLAQKISDIIGIDYYPRIAAFSLASKNVYLDTTHVPWGRGDWGNLAGWARTHGKKFMVAEGQAEPWEITIVPPRPPHFAPYSCTPEALIQNYNAWMSFQECSSLYAYLFWGAEYWLYRWKQGDKQYLDAFTRVLEHA
jgi:hypothetical protein